MIIKGFTAKLVTGRKPGTQKKKYFDRDRGLSVAQEHNNMLLTTRIWRYLFHRKIQTPKVFGANQTYWISSPSVNNQSKYRMTVIESL